MGTNYYLHRDVCPHCGRGDGEPWHIGKSSAGWCFALHVEPNGIDWDGDSPAISDLDDWRKIWAEPTTLIRDECGDTLTPEEMERIITRRNWRARYPNPFYETEADFCQKNHCSPGPNGLARRNIGPGCVAHGEGTWDCITGEFS